MRNLEFPVFVSANIRKLLGPRRAGMLVDLLLLALLGALIAGVVELARDWTAPLRQAVEIDLRPRALPGYMLLSLSRGFAAYLCSLGFTLVYGTIAAHSRRAEKFMIPLLDILQGIPVLGFLPGLVLGMVALFPHSNVGLELACILMIFTGQVWNMTFAFYGSLRSIPAELQEVARLHRFSWAQRVRNLEVSSAAVPLVWNSMMSMAGGWFFLTITEAFTMGNHDFRLPGIGSYMSVAIRDGNVPAMVYAVIAMFVMIVATDQFVWRPAVAYAQRFRFEDTDSSEQVHSWVLSLLRRSRIVARLRSGPRGERRSRFRPTSVPASTGVTHPATSVESGRPHMSLAAIVKYFVGIVALFLLGWGCSNMFLLLHTLSWSEWQHVAMSLLFTFFRTSAAVAIAVLWTVPVGVTIGLSPRLSRIFQPVIQITASFPAPMLFPLVTAGLVATGFNFSAGCVVLMLLGAQWYVLFNVIAGAMAIPTDLREAAAVCGMKRSQRWRRLYLPGIFPSLVTGMITAAGGAWNASIVSEYVQFRGRTLVAPGVGSMITEATTRGDFHVLAAGVLSMSLALVLINRFFWKRLYKLADARYALNR